MRKCTSCDGIQGDTMETRHVHVMSDPTIPIDLPPDFPDDDWRRYNEDYEEPPPPLLPSIWPDPETLWISPYPSMKMCADCNKMYMDGFFHDCAKPTTKTEIDTVPCPVSHSKGAGCPVCKGTGRATKEIP